MEMVLQDSKNVWNGHNADCSAWRGTYDSECKGCLLDRVDKLAKQVLYANHKSECPYWKWDWQYAWDEMTDCICGDITDV